ncbi:MAG: acylphosphatase, partial [Salinibacterium sp.]
MPRKHVVVTGRVQGVGFRYSTCREAMRRGIGGYARNLPDGSVEVEVEGRREQLADMIEWLHTGPLGSKVMAVDVS